MAFSSVVKQEKMPNYQISQLYHRQLIKLCPRRPVGLSLMVGWTSIATRLCYLAALVPFLIALPIEYRPSFLSVVESSSPRRCSRL